MADKMPVLFMGQETPMNVVLENSYTTSLKALGVNLPKPKAMRIFSAHRLTKGT
jgi:4,5-DOPA dioxygenase extradiol